MSIFIFYNCYAHLIICTWNLRTTSIKLLLLLLLLLLDIVINFDPEKKLSHSSGKSSKNKKNKQKGKGKADSAEKESWRHETVPKLEQSAVAEQPATETTSDHSNETESTSLVQSTELKQVTDTATNQEEQIVKSQAEITENKVAAIEPDERNECDSGMEPKAEVTSENEANHADTYRASEKAKSDVVFRQEPVVPLRSRGEIILLQSHVRKLSKCLKTSSPSKPVGLSVQIMEVQTSDWDSS